MGSAALTEESLRAPKQQCLPPPAAMATPLVKKGFEETAPEQQIHKIRITLTSKNVKAVEKGEHQPRALCVCVCVCARGARRAVPRRAHSGWRAFAQCARTSSAAPRRRS